MSDVAVVHELQSLQDLLHELDGLDLQKVVFFSDEVEQLASRNAER